MIRTDRGIPDYNSLIDPIRKARQDKSGKQPDDPAKAAQVLLQNYRGRESANTPFAWK
jgi:hypothetical protein